MLLRMVSETSSNSVHGIYFEEAKRERLSRNLKYLLIRKESDLLGTNFVCAFSGGHCENARPALRISSVDRFPC